MSKQELKLSWFKGMVVGKLIKLNKKIYIII